MKATCSKWEKYNFMIRLPGVKNHLPQTKQISRRSLFHMLKSKSVILKPSFGALGYGVIKVSAGKHGNYEIHQENWRQYIKSNTRLLTALKKTMGQKEYLLQEFIPLATINKRPFDIRVMVQRIKKRPWVVTGCFVKVAPRSYIITNAATHPLSLTKALDSSSVRNKSRSIIKRLNKLTLNVGKHLSKYYPAITKIGFDVGIDNKGKLWIIEANFKPSIGPFKLLKDKSVYKRVIYFLRQNNQID